MLLWFTKSLKLQTLLDLKAQERSTTNEDACLGWATGLLSTVRC